MWINDDSGLLLEVLEFHDNHLLVKGRGEPFQIQPPRPEAVTLTFGKGDPLNRVQAAQVMGYDPIYVPEAG